jgi:hypothetical protein
VYRLVPEKQYKLFPNQIAIFGEEEVLSNADLRNGELLIIRQTS